MFSARPSGSTTRRPDVLGRRIQRALHDPHSASERFDLDFVLAMRCEACGKLGMAPRRSIRAAVEDHAGSCPRRHDVSAVAVRVFYPKQ